MERDYPGEGKWTVNIATDTNSSHPVRRPWEGYASFDRLIELDLPDLPAARDWQIIFPKGPLTGALDGVPGTFTCAAICYFEYNRNTGGPKYHPAVTPVTFTPDNPELPKTILPSATTVDPHPAINYLVAGSWLYIPEDVESTDYDFGVFAAGGDPYSFSLQDPTGTVTYRGVASGQFFAGQSVGTFNTDVVVMVNFDTDEVSLRAENFRIDAAPAGFPAELQLQSDSIMGHAVSGTVTDGAAWVGEGKVAFYGNGVTPASVVGTFGSSDGENGLVGYFVASP